MSIGTPEPALLHSYLAGQRGGGGGFFDFRLVSTGAPGASLWVPASNDAQGRTQNARSSGFPLASLWWMQRWEPCLQSAFFVQFLPSPAVRGSRVVF
jgi:hypothetical protein